TSGGRTPAPTSISTACTKRAGCARAAAVSTASAEAKCEKTPATRSVPRLRTRPAKLATSAKSSPSPVIPASILIWTPPARPAQGRARGASRAGERARLLGAPDGDGEIVRADRLLFPGEGPAQDEERTREIRAPQLDRFRHARHAERLRTGVEERSCCRHRSV